MTIAMSCRVTFPAREGRNKITLRAISEFEMESGWKLLTDTAELTLPRNVKFFDRNNVKEVFKRGDEVIVELGYGTDENLMTEFVGYVKEVSADIPIKMKLEDEMFKIKSIPVNFSSPDISLENLLKQIIPGYEIDALEGCQLGAVRFSQTTVGEVLEKLQQDLKIYTYVQPTTQKIVSGKIYADDSDKPAHRFNLERNAVSNDLNYRNREDIKVKVKGCAVNKGVKIEFEFGDDNPDKNIEWQFNVKTKPELEIEVKRFYEANKRDGFDGSFTAFGRPVVTHGEKVKLKSQLYPDRDGTYYVESVRKTFGIDGYRQIITLGNRFENG